MQKMQQIFVAFFLLFWVNIEAAARKGNGCTQRAICAHGFTPKKNCGTWWCYRDYPNMPMEWRGYWGVTHVCEWTWPGSHAVSVHCKEENVWTLQKYHFFFIGLFIPEGLPWHPLFFRWTDGTRINFLDWAPAGFGSAFHQPHNEVPIERVVDNTGHWHDTISRNPVTHRILCKRKPQKVITTCPTTRKPTTHPSTTPKPTPADVVMLTPPKNDVPALPPATPKPSSRSCYV